MASQNSLFRMFLLCLAVAAVSAISPISNCLSNCATCEPNNLAVCKGTQPCEWGHHDPAANGTCSLLPTMRTLSEELNGKPISKTASWGEEAKYSTCQYTFQGKKKVVDVLGVFGGTTALTKTFTVTPARDVYILSFNLVRDEWLPFNDFLLVQISSGNNDLLSLEISYEERVKVQSQTTTLSCSGKRFINEKYHIRITGTVGSELTVVFTSFLFSSKWALTNIKLLQGCDAFSGFDEKAQSCSKCDSDAYLVQSKLGDLWCEKCPALCSSCNSKTECTSCVSGAKLDAGKCYFSADSKLQWADLSIGKTTCGGSSFLMGHLGKTVAIAPISNDNNHLYDEVQMGFSIYYNPSHWNAKTLQKIKMKINKVEVLTIGYQNLTSTVTDQCKQFKGERIAMINLLSKTIIQMSNVLNIQFELVGKTNITFGVQNVYVKSLTKKTSSENSKQLNHDSKSSHKNETGNKLTQESSNEVASTPSITTTSSTSAYISLSSPPLSPPASTLSAAPPATTTTTSLTSSTPATASSTSGASTGSTASNTSSTVSSTPQTPVTIIQTQQVTEIVYEQVNDQIESSPLSFSQTHQSPISFMPTTCQSTSGLQITIPNVNQIKGYLTISIDKLDQSTYHIASSFIDDSILHICLALTQSFTDATIKVYDSPSSSTSRLLQGSDSTLLALGTVTRFDSLSSAQLNSISSFSVFFSVFAWTGVILIICAVLLGYGVTMQEFIFSLQFLFLHIYIASESLPLSFREVIAGLRIVENLNFFVPSQASSIEHQWMGNVIQHGPERLSLYNTDINFSREFYPILIVNIIYGLWFCAVMLARKWLTRLGEKSMIGRLAYNLTNRVVNFADQTWRYQFLATIWFCMVQFHNLAYPIGSNRSQTLNAIFCICCFLGTLAWPILIGYYCRKQYYENEYEQFVFQFEDLYYLRIPRYYLPTPHHRVGYRAFTGIKSFLIALLIACFGRTPVILIPLLAIQAGELVYIHRYEIFSDKRYFKLKAIENGLFAVLEVMLLVVYSAEETASTNTYVGLGWILSTIGMLVTINGAARAGYLIFRKYSDLMGVEFEEADPDHNKLKTERVV